MTPETALVVDNLESLSLTPTRQPIYDREIGIRLLHQDDSSGAEHYLIRYPAGLTAMTHRHTAAHTIVVLDGALEANGQVVRAPAYCHFPAGEPMHHGPADGGGCLFIIIFDGPFDVDPGE